MIDISRFYFYACWLYKTKREEQKIEDMIIFFVNIFFQQGFRWEGFSIISRVIKNFQNGSVHPTTN